MACISLQVTGIFVVAYLTFRFSYYDVLFFIYLILLVFKKDCSPGPKYNVDYHYTRHGRDGTPHYSMLGKSRDVGKKIELPSREIFQEVIL